jgi:hypothetical protein
MRSRRLPGRVRRVLGPDQPLADLFEGPTPAALAWPMISSARVRRPQDVPAVGPARRL